MQKGYIGIKDWRQGIRTENGNSKNGIWDTQHSRVRDKANRVYGLTSADYIAYMGRKANSFNPGQGGRVEIHLFKDSRLLTGENGLLERVQVTIF